MNLRVAALVTIVGASFPPVQVAHGQHESARTQTSQQLYSAGQLALSAGDTIQALQAFEASVRKDQTNAAAWYALGRVASESTRRWWRVGVMPGGIPSRLLLADSAYSLAIRLEPDSICWYAEFADYLFAAHVTDLARAIRILHTGLKSGERTGQTVHNSKIANQLGLLWWRRYEAIANRSWAVSGKGLNHGEFVTRWYEYPDFLKYYAQKLDPPTGLADFEFAYRYFRHAVQLNPDDDLAFRHLAMALVEQSRWDELIAIAQRAIARDANRPWPHLALGLGMQRTGFISRASDALDRGFALLPANETANFLDIERVSSPARTAAVAFGGPTDSAAARAQLTDAFWGVANPSLLIPGNAVYTEFRARVVHAELRWSNEETSLHGVDSDRGDVFIRWGPPDNISNFRGGMGPISEGWLYRQFRFSFFFSAQPTYGTARMMAIYRSYVYEHVIREFPAGWNNLGIVRYGQYDIPIVAYRFRGTNDSMRTAVWASVPVGALHATRGEKSRGKAPQPRGVTKVQATALDALWQRTTTEARSDTSPIVDSSTTTVIPMTLSTPLATQYLRLDALSEIASTGEMRVAKGVMDLRNDMRSGFSMSDVVVARSISEPRSPPPARWSDFVIAPLPDRAVPKGAPLDLLWEVYEPSVRDGKARYRVAVQVGRKSGNGFRAVAARVLDGILGASVQVDANAPLSIAYERTVPSAEISVERIRLDLGNIAEGDYAVTVTVTDTDSQRRVIRTHAFRVVTAK